MQAREKGPENAQLLQVWNNSRATDAHKKMMHSSSLKYPAELFYYVGLSLSDDERSQMLSMFGPRQ